MGLASPFEVYAQITGQDYLERVYAYEKEYYKVMHQFSDFTTEQGAQTFYHFHRLVGLKFAGDPPSEWTKPRGRAPSFPKRGTAAHAAVKALPNLPNPYDVYGDKILFQYSYDEYSESGERVGNGSGYFTHRMQPQILWTEGETTARTYFLIVFDVAAFLKVEKAERPNRHYSPELYAWTWPEGLERRTEAEFELIFAQARVDAERAETAKKEKANDV